MPFRAVAARRARVVLNARNNFARVSSLFGSLNEPIAPESVR